MARAPASARLSGPRDRPGAPTLSFHYVREPGSEGQILTGDGDSVGLPLSELLDHGGMPVGAALELVSYLADILTIADEDRAQHGDIKPGNVRVDETGAVSIEGWGVERRSGRAPEGAGSAPADVYGVGVVLHACLTGSGLGALPRNREDHDSRIAERIAEIDWQELNDKRWMDEVLHFICGMMSFDPASRPVPLDVANILGQVSAQADGEALIDWAGRVVEPLSRDEPKRPAPLAVEDEDLGGPEVLASPVSQGQAFSMRKAASAKGESTAFWTRDRIAEMLADDDEDDEPVRERFQPGEGRGRGTLPPPPPPPTPTPPAAPRSRSAPPSVPPFPDATMEGQPAFVRRDAPPPNLYAASHDAPEPASAQPPRPPVMGARSGSQPPSIPPRPATTGPSPVPSPPAPVAAAPRPSGPGATRPDGFPVPGSGAAVAPYAVPGAATTGASPADETAGNGSRLKVFIAVGAALVFLCGGGAATVAAVAYTMNREDPAEAEAPRPAATPAPAAPAKDAAEDTGTETAPAPATRKSKKSTTRSGSAKSTSSRSSSSRSSSTRSSSTPKSSSRSSSTPKSSTRRTSSRSGTASRESRSKATPAPTPAPTPTPAPAPAPAAGGFPATVKWVHHGVETTLECSPGGRKVFVGTMRMEIEDVTTCRVQTETGRTALQLKGGGTVTCSESAGRLGCSGPR